MLKCFKHTYYPYPLTNTAYHTIIQRLTKNVSILENQKISITLKNREMEKIVHSKINPERSLFFGSMVTEKDADLLIKQLFELNKTKGDIFVQINSNGGSFAGARKLYDNIALSPNPVYGIVAGNAFSAAAIVLQACHKRCATKLSKLLIHHLMCPLSFDLKINDKTDIKKMIEKETNRVQENEKMMMEILKKRMTISEEEILKILDDEPELSALTAQKIGLIDEII